MSRWNLTWLLGVPAALMCGIVFASSARQPEKDYQRIRTIVDVLAEVEFCQEASISVAIN